MKLVTLTLLFISLVVLSINVAKAQTTAFSYQGRLTDGGNAASGSFQMQFKLFDSLSGGTQIGSTVADVPVTVNQGTFTVRLDFGSNALSGANRWLEIGVRHNSGEAYSILSPREQLASSPYAVRTLLAASADSLSNSCVGCVTSNQIQSVSGSTITGNVPVASIPAGSANYVQNTTAPQATANFNISGNGTAGGTLSGNIVSAATQFNIGTNRILSNAGNSNLFAGVLAGQVNASGTGNVFVGPSAGRSNTIGGGNSFFGFNAGFSNVGDTAGNGNGNSFFGSRAGNNNTGSL